MTGETVQIALEVIGVLEDLAIPHHVGGSFASSVHGFPRQTDILGIIRTQGDRLDLGYLRNWASTLEVDDLLERALAL